LKVKSANYGGKHLADRGTLMCHLIRHWLKRFADVVF